MLRPPGCPPGLSLLVACLSLFAALAAADSRARNPLARVARLVQPVVHTPGHRVHARSVFQLSFSAGGHDYRLRLHPNDNILADDAALHHVDADGAVTIEELRRDEHRVYMGDAFAHKDGAWTRAGWASVYVHADGAHPVFEGAFQADGDHVHIQTGRTYHDTRVAGDPWPAFLDALDAHDLDTEMVVWRDADVVTGFHGELRRNLDRASCTSDQLLFNRDASHPVFSGDTGDLLSRQVDGSGPSGGNSAGVNLASTIGSTDGCPTTRKVALLGVAADCTYAASFATRANASSNIIQQINTASRVYEAAFNISLGIQNLLIQNSSCPSDEAVASSATPWNAACSSGIDLAERLSRFSRWRGDSTNDTNAFWMLLSTCATDSAVGLAWLGQLCVAGATSGAGNETVAATNIVLRTSTEWEVMAHETGHTFGAVHDCTSASCADGTVTRQQCCPLSASSCNAGGAFIMNPSTVDGISSFSQCSIGNVCSALGRNSVKSACLSDNRNVVTIQGSECGNGIVEEGEECDCGGAAGCAATGNTCCDPATCRFVTNALCDPSNDECCTSACQLASAGTVCRSSTGDCDPAETCSGSSASCPADETAADGTACTLDGVPADGLACAAGQCTSRDQQCRMLIGAATSAGNDTYACSSQGCALSCAAPAFGFGTCVSMDQNFLDGTPCEGGGRCDNGNCEGADFGREIASSIKDNLEIVIPVSVVVGVLFLAAVFACIGSAIRRRRRRRMLANLARRGIPPAPPPMMDQRRSWFGFAGSRLSRGGPPVKYGQVGPGENIRGENIRGENIRGENISMGAIPRPNAQAGATGAAGAAGARTQGMHSTSTSDSSGAMPFYPPAPYAPYPPPNPSHPAQQWPSQQWPPQGRFA